MSRNVIFISAKSKKEDTLYFLGACEKIFPNQIACKEVVDDTRITSPKSPTLIKGFKSLAASNNPILWIDHHGEKNNKNCSYSNLRIREPRNMARLIFENAKIFLDPRTSSSRRTIEIYQFSCYGSQHHIQLLASELKKLGFRNFKIWGTREIFNVSYYSSTSNCIFVKFPNTGNANAVVLDPFWKKTADGGYLYADCIHVDKKGIKTEIWSAYTRMGRSERINHVANVAKNNRTSQQRHPLLPILPAPQGRRDSLRKKQLGIQQMLLSAPQRRTSPNRGEQELIAEIIRGRPKRQAYLRQQQR